MRAAQAVVLASVTILAPPSSYLPYDGALIRVVRPLSQVDAICRALGTKADSMIYGCAVWGEGGCLEIIASTAERFLIERHEDAHCNGWRHA